MIGMGELLVILCIVLLLFGGKQLPEFAKNLGKGIREFKKACNGESDESSCSVKCCEQKQSDCSTNACKKSLEHNAE